jgi:phage terminase small subunit
MKLTRKQKAFADTLINNPKISATQAAAQTYNTTTRGSAAITAHENLLKPNVQLYLSAHIDKAKNRIVTLVDSDKEEIALRASDSILDRALGKATQRIEQHSTSVNLNLDLTNITEKQ